MNKKTKQNKILKEEFDAREGVEILTSESVNIGHPDKTCDTIADAFLDEALKYDPDSQMAVECAIKDNKLFIYGEATTKAKIDYDKIAREVIRGEWGNGEERKERLKKAGYSYEEVQNRVNELLAEDKKSIDEIANEVIRGEWGNGEERKKRLRDAGYDYDAVQKRVNEKIG